MKICLISFDYWKYDQYIIKELEQRGIHSTHIDISTFKYNYKNKFEKYSNFLSKLFFKKNIKKIKRQEYILSYLKNIKKQDYILIIRPDLVERDTHLKIKQYANIYNAYLYDSTKRFPVDHLLSGIFNKVYSFDFDDVKKYNLEHITNYIYLEKQPIREVFEYDLFIVISPDNRIKILNKIAEQLDAINIKYKFIVVSNKRPAELHKNIEHRSSKVTSDELKNYLEKSKIILDLIREGHNGLSFRIFESLAYQKKLITTNQTIKKYDFYNPKNIKVIDINNINIDSSFFLEKYKVLDENVYYKYTISNFVETVFKL